MHKDTKEALDRLEAELLAEEPSPRGDDDEIDLPEDFPDEDEGVYADPPGGYQNFANGYRIRNSDDVDVDLDDYADEVYEEPEKAGIGSLILPGAAVLCAAAALVYILLRIL